MRLSIMHTYPGHPEQEVHIDADPNDGIYFLSIPLQYTTIDMGSTIFYDDRYVKYIRKQKIKENNKQNIIPNNMGFVTNFSKKHQESLNKGRRIFNLDVGDLTIHSSNTLHHGGANKTNKNRHYIFIMVATNEIGFMENYDIEDEELFLASSQKRKVY